MNRSVLVIAAVCIAASCGGDDASSESTTHGTTVATTPATTTTAPAATEPSTTTTMATTTTLAALEAAIPPAAGGIRLFGGDNALMVAGGHEDGSTSFTVVDLESGETVDLPISIDTPSVSNGFVVGPDALDDRGWALELATAAVHELPALSAIVVSPDGTEAWGATHNDGDPGVVRIDLSTAEETFFPTPAGGLAFGEGVVWVADGRGIQRLDPVAGTHGFVARFEDQAAAHTEPLADSGLVVVMDRSTQKVLVYHVTADSTTEIAPSCPEPPCRAGAQFHNVTSEDEVFAHDGYLFFRNHFARTLVKYDPATGATTEHDFELGPGTMAFSDGVHLWWATGDGALGVWTWNRIDPETMAVIDSVEAGRENGTFPPAQVGEWVWAPSNELVRQLDPTTLTLVAEWPGLGVPVVAGDRLWAPCLDGACVRELLPAS